MQRLKISREGIILIKSFEGFRPHAVRRDDGQWVIGYGHTLSAREGGIVSEPDAELLLQFDLIPVAKALNDTAGPLNQHQFDALASFAFSVGLDRFESSDVLSRLTSGDQGQAADAIVGWSEPTPSDTPLRRRAAERALCVADPGRPVALAELLSAPLPPPPSVAPVAVTPVAVSSVPTPAFEPVEDVAPEPVVEAVPELSGALPVFASAETAPEPLVTTTEPASDADALIEPTTELASIGDDAEAVAEVAAPDASTVEAEAPLVEAVSDPVAEASDLADRAEQEAADLSPVADVSATEVVDEQPALETPSSQTPPSLHRYAPYSATIIGPLSGTPASYIPVGVTPSETVGADATNPFFGEVPPLPEPVAPFPASSDPEPEPEVPALDFAEPVAGFDTASDLPPAAPSDTPVETIAFPEPLPFQPAISAELPADTDGELQVQAPLDEGSIFPTQRLVWPHAEPSADQTPLFEDDGALRLGAHQMIRHEIVSEEPRRIDWRETGLYVLMGMFGLVTFGMSMAAFRRASLPSGGSEFTTIAWVLAVFGFACIAVSAWNLYRKLGRAED
ncbi:hypothetical protein BH09PSE1_BH09PSE1_12750 [soil metagenome]